MDALPRSRRLFLIPRVALAALVGHVSLVGLGACGGPKKDAIIGASTSNPAMRPKLVDAGVIAGDAGIPADYESTFTKLSPVRIVSNGHAAGRWDVDVFVNDAAKEPVTTGHGAVPVGAKVISVHYERAGAGGRGPLMMMDKREKGFDPDHGDWRYVVLSSAGDIVKDGAIEGCVGCHDDAPNDHLFKLTP